MPAKYDKTSDSALRAFIAIELPEAVQSQLREVQEKLKEYKIKMTWSRPENIHLTLKFLGDVRKELVAPIGHIIKDAAKQFHPMKLRSQAIGFFPGIKRPRVLWTGLLGQTHDLAELCRTLDERLSTLGFKRETRNFTGHLTLGRFKESGNPELLIEMMKGFQNMRTDVFLADSINLYKSKLMPSGPMYTKLVSVSLTDF